MFLNNKYGFMALYFLIKEIREMGALLIGLAAGCALPFQTSVNANLNRRMGSPFVASFISFSVGTIFLAALVLITYHKIYIPFGTLSGEPFWIWLGGLCGVTYLTCNILLMPKLGAVQTVVFPVTGLILSGLVIDQFGLFRSTQIPMSATRVLGAALVIGGVVLITLAKSAGAKKAANTDKNAGASLWLYRLLGVAAGCLSGMQIAMNGYLGKCMEAPLIAALISFIVGTLSVLILLIIMRPRINKKSELTEKFPAWIWIGGTIGAVYVFCNAYIAPIIGTGMAAVVVQTGQMCGSLTIDHFGLVRSAKNAITTKKVLGIVLMLIGAAIIRLL